MGIFEESIKHYEACRPDFPKDIKEGENIVVVYSFPWITGDRYDFVGFKFVSESEYKKV